MPHEGYVNPLMNNGPRFHLDMPISELVERDTRAIKASVVSLVPLVAETTDRVTHKTRLTPTEPNRAWGLEQPDPTQESNRLRFEGRPAKGSRSSRVKQSQRRKRR